MSATEAYREGEAVKGEDMNNEPGTELTRVEAIATMIALASTMRAYYLALIEEGWAPDEAFKITLAWQHGAAGGRA